TRRRFMVGAANGAGALAAAAFTLPALAFAVGPIFKHEQWTWQPIGHPSDFPNDNFVTRVVQIQQGPLGAAGQSNNTLAFVRTRNPALDTEPEDQYNHWVALSSRCMHLGCPVRWTPAAARFICPCHGGVYDIRGMVTGGPPVRPLDRFYTRLNRATGLVEAGTTAVDWIDERTSLSPGLRWMLFRKVPRGVNWYYTLGSATLFAFLNQAVTGVFLAMYYQPNSAGGAYESVRFITADVFLGQ